MRRHAVDESAVHFLVVLPALFSFLVFTPNLVFLTFLFSNVERYLCESAQVATIRVQCGECYFCAKGRAVFTDPPNLLREVPFSSRTFSKCAGWPAQV